MARVGSKPAGGARPPRAKAASPRVPRRPRLRRLASSEHSGHLLQQLAKPRQNETTVQTRLARLLEWMGLAPLLGYKIGGGEADIVIGEANTVIECKASGAADPDKQGSVRSGDEEISQRDQLFRYMAGLRDAARAGLDIEGGKERPWLGILTDGRRWWAWKWPVGSSKPETSYEFFEAGTGDQKGAFNRIADLLFASERQGLPWAPEDLGGLFQGKEMELRGIFVRASSDPDVDLKFQIWLDTLKASGMVPDSPPKRFELFVKHCYLAAVSKAVINSLTPGSESESLEQTIREQFRSHFASWLLSNSAPGGMAWLRSIYDSALNFNWRMRDSDVMRNFYQSVIGKADRKAYGEYYTPDWLAEMLAEEILDDEWVEASARASLEVGRGKRADLDGVGVLDPACGSGTFLFHAARRIARARTFEDCSRQETADAVARLVHGIDVHPVAVEMARATLLRALPAVPTNGEQALNIHQGDSLLAGRNDESGLVDLVNFSTGDTSFALPSALLLRDDFRRRVYDLVESVRDGREGVSVPSSVISGLSAPDKKSVVEAHRRLLTICREKGNSVWFWFVVNSIAPHRLAKKKVDRILANPPWVRMSNIQVPERKGTLKELAVRLKLWVGGKNATGFDIASIFVLRCRSLYLSGGTEETPNKRLPGTAAAWVTNSGSIAGENWAEFQDLYGRKTATRVLDLREVRRPPFTGAKSCVWVEGVGRGSIEQRSLRNLGDAAIVRSDSWVAAREKATWVKVDRPPPQVASPYAGENGNGASRSGAFRNGATVFPHSLVLVKSFRREGRGRASFETRSSRQGRWGEVESQSNDVPERWLAKVMFPKDLLPFCVRDEVSRAVIPLDPKGNLETHPECELYWKEAERIYAANRGGGSATPKSLLRRLDFGRGLSAQLPLRKGGVSSVVYNSAGQGIRAARAPSDVLIEHFGFHLQPSSQGEASYLVAVLNADCLQEAFRAARKSDRHFCAHIWRSVPVPRYDAESALHREIAALSRRAEVVAANALKKVGGSSGQVQASGAIRGALRGDGVAGDIDEAVRRLLPDHASR